MLQQIYGVDGAPIFNKAVVKAVHLGDDNPE